MPFRHKIPSCLRSLHEEGIERIGMAKKLKFSTEQILFIQKGLCSKTIMGGKAVDKGFRKDKPKRRFDVPEPSCVAKEISEREKRGETIRAGFFDDLVCGKEKFTYVGC